MSNKRFTEVYWRNVLEPSYQNWLRLFKTASFQVHRAHLLMLFRQGIISKDTAGSINKALNKLERTFEFPAVLPNGVEDLYFILEQALGEEVGQENAAWLHTARSRNDMDTTIFRMVLKNEFRNLIQKLTAVCSSMELKAQHSEGLLTVLYTHGQPANPSTFAHYVMAMAQELADTAGYCLDALDDINKSTMGAAAITGSGFPIDRVMVAQLLGFSAYAVNTYQAISTGHWLERPAQAVQLLMVDISRCIADILHKASCEVGLVVFPDDLVQVSSIMPQKRNPVILEHVRIQASSIIDTCSAMLQHFRNVPFQDVNENADAPVAQFLDTLGKSAELLDLFEETVLKMMPDTERAREISMKFGVTTTELADDIVRRTGVGFRVAHALCSAFVASGYSFDVLRNEFYKKTGKMLPYGDDELRRILEPETFIRVRSVPGGPARDGMKENYSELEKKVMALQKSVAESLERESAGIKSTMDGLSKI